MDSTASKKTKSQRSPTWLRDELILALNLFKHHSKILSAKHNDVVELSNFLKKMGTVMGRSMPPDFRTPNSVAMKLSNFSHFDQNSIDAGRQGLPNGSKEDLRVWNYFLGYDSKLITVAASIRTLVEAACTNSILLLGVDESDEQEAEEGKILTRAHRQRERHRGLVNAKKKEAFNKLGRLACEVCAFNFEECYGALASNIIDVHHTRPLHTLHEGEKTRLKDLALLCSNCHRMIHSSKKWLEIDQLRALITNKNSTERTIHRQPKN